MLSVELELSLINKYDFDTRWTKITQKFLSNGKEEVILHNKTITAEEQKKIYPAISVIYNGTDEDFLKKYNEIIKDWDKEKGTKYYMEKLNISKAGATVLSEETCEIIYGYEDEI